MDVGILVVQLARYWTLEYWLYNWLDSGRWNIGCTICKIVDVGILAVQLARYWTLEYWL